MRYPAETIHRQISEVLRAWGMPPDVVRTAADVMTDTDLAGIDSHGISMLMLYEEALGLEQLNPTPVPRIVRESPVTALVDGDAGLGHVAAVFGMELAIRKATAMGVGSAIMLEAGLSFLGLGVQPPAASWGNMIAAGRDVVVTAPWVSLVPGLAVVIVTMCATIIGDAERDRLAGRRSVVAQRTRIVTTSRGAAVN